MRELTATHSPSFIFDAFRLAHTSTPVEKFVQPGEPLLLLEIVEQRGQESWFSNESQDSLYLATSSRDVALYHRQVLENVPIVCNTQLYLDLFQHPTRGKEAAEFLRKERMKI